MNVDFQKQIIQNCPWIDCIVSKTVSIKSNLGFHKLQNSDKFIYPYKRT